MAGAVGTDGVFLLESLKEAGVNTSHVKILQEVRTGNAIILNPSPMNGKCIAGLLHEKFPNATIVLTLGGDISNHIWNKKVVILIYEYHYFCFTG